MYDASVFFFPQLPSLLFASFFNMQVKVVLEEKSERNTRNTD